MKNPNCKYHELCGLGANADPEAGLCILHSKDPDKDKQAFAEALEKHRKEKGYNFSFIQFPVVADFSGVTFHQRARFGGTVFSKEANFDGTTFLEEANFTGANCNFNRTFKLSNCHL